MSEFYELNSYILERRGNSLKNRGKLGWDWEQNSIQSLHCFIEAFQVRFQSVNWEKSDGEIK